MSDGRAGDVAQVERLLRAADQDGAVRLPELSAAELYTLCGDGQVLLEDAEYAWWHGLATGTREQLAKAAVSLLSFRELLRPPRDDPGDSRPAGDQAMVSEAWLEMAPELSVIVAARQRPVVVAVGTIGGDVRDGAPRMYGLGGLDGRPRAVVAEQITSQAAKPSFGSLHKFGLVSLFRAAEALVGWACQPRGRMRGGQRREISIYRHREGEPLTLDTAAVTHGDGTLMVTRRQSGAPPAPPEPYHHDSLVRLAAAMLSGDAP